MVVSLQTPSAGSEPSQDFNHATSTAGRDDQQHPLKERRDKLLDERSALAVRRDKELEKVRNKYRPLTDAVDAKLREISLEHKERRRDTAKFPTPAMLRHQEADDAPMRLCAGCKKPMLTATIANAQRVEAALAFSCEDRETRPVGAPMLRAMRHSSHCCFQCAKGEGHHSRLCRSKIQVELVEEEYAQRA